MLTLSDISTKMQNAMNESPNTLMGNVTKAIKLATYNVTMLVAQKRFIDYNEDELNQVTAMLECTFPEAFVHYMFYVDKELFESNYSSMGMDYMRKHLEEQMINATVEMTKAVLLLSYVYPQFTCIQELYYNFLFYLTQRMDSSIKVKPNMDWMLDSDIGGETTMEDLMMGCDHGRTVNKCLKKIGATCKMER